MNPDQLLQIALTILVPLVIAAEAKWVSKIPSTAKPYVALALGQVGQFVTVWLTQHPYSAEAGLISGAAGIGIREAAVTIKNHAVALLSPTNADVTALPPK